MGSHCVQQESRVALTSLRGPFCHPWVTLSCRTYIRKKTQNLCRIFPKLIFFSCNALVQGPKSSRHFWLAFTPLSPVLAFVAPAAWMALWHMADYLEDTGCIHLAQLLDILASRIGGQEETVVLSLSRPPQMSPQPASSPLSAEQHHCRSLSPTPTASEDGMCSVLFLPNNVPQVRPSPSILWWLSVDWRVETTDQKEHCHGMLTAVHVATDIPLRLKWWGRNKKPGLGYWGKSNRICYWGWLSSISECPMADFIFSSINH